MTLAEVVAAYRFAGVPDPERLAAAFIAAVTPPAAGVPPCPQCAAPGGPVWLGGLPDGSDHWRCVICGHSWATPPAGSAERGADGDLA